MANNNKKNDIEISKSMTNLNISSNDNKIKFNKKDIPKPILKWVGGKTQINNKHLNVAFHVDDYFYKKSKRKRKKRKNKHLNK